jgi:hypothetical protein
MTAIVKATLRSGIVRSFSKTADNPSPAARADKASPILDQIDMVTS